MNESQKGKNLENDFQTPFLINVLPKRQPKRGELGS